MSKLDELLRELCPNGVEYKKLGEIATVLRGASPRPIKKYITNDSDGVNWIKIGDVPVGSKYITQSEEKITKEGAEKSRYVRKGDFILSNSMSFGRPYILAIDGCIHDGWLSISNFKDVFLSDYLYYLLSSSAIQQEMKKRASFGGAVQNLNADIVKALVLPVPPIEVQSEIVRMLDSYTESVVELQRQLTAELTARKTQYSHYRDKMLTFGDDDKFKWKNLGDMCDILTGYPFDSSQFQVSGVRLMRGMNIKRGNLFFSEEINRYWNSADGLEKYLLKENDIVIAMDGSLVGKSFGIVQAEYLPLLLVQRVARIRSKQVNNRYIYHYIACRFPSYVEKKKTGGAIPHVSQKDIASFRVPIPSADVQNRIVNVLDNFEKICSDLNIGLPAEIEARQKQYEYYRDKLLTFAETGNTILSRAEQSRAEQSRAEQSRAEH